MDTLDRLRTAYWALNPRAAAGADGVTWGAYGQDLEANLQDLHGRVHRGAYRARPSRRVYIPKADGRLRPLGIASLEDKILQRAVVEVLNAVYEVDFLGFSYGFRPGRSPHDALDALAVGIEKRKVNWILDADIRGFYEAPTYYRYRGPRAVVITRRRHPLEGRALPVLGRMRRHGQLELLLVLPDGSKSLIPSAWTDLEEPTNEETVHTPATLG